MKFLCLLLLLAIITMTPASAAEASIYIFRNPPTVWTAIQQQRHYGPDVLESTELWRDGNIVKIRQKHIFASPVGVATMTLLCHEFPYVQINYTLIESDKFTKFQGSWLIEATPKGTKLTLICNVKLKNPFIPQFIINSVMKARLKKRVEEVKHYSEDIL